MAADIPNVNSMHIYTRGGDKGQTSIYGGKRVSKSDLRVEACGQIDELSSFIGLLIMKIDVLEEKKFFTAVQKKLYIVMSILSGVKVKLSVKRDVAGFETRINQIESKLSKIHRFILPQGNELSVFFHIARVVCRRAERNIVRYFGNNNSIDQEYTMAIIKYLNRLSDLLFILARFYNREKEIIT